MWAPERWLSAACLLLLAAGGVGIATQGHRAGRDSRAATGAAVSGPTGGPATSLPSGPAPGSAVLAERMIEPTDVGGGYRVEATRAAAVLDSAPCLAGLQPSARQAGRAATAVVGPGPHSVPDVVEVAASYPGAGAAAVYRDVVAAVGACPAFAFSFAGSPVDVPLVAGTIAPVGVADQVWSGSFSYSGAPLRLQLGVVLDGRTVLALVWVDSVPPSAGAAGDFASTLGAAAEKLA